MRGGTFTITNLGGIGGTGFSPIVNYPEVAILGLSRARMQPVVRNAQVVTRLLLPLSLSYDHRVIDGRRRCPLHPPYRRDAGRAVVDVIASVREFSVFSFQFSVFLSGAYPLRSPV